MVCGVCPAYWSPTSPPPTGDFIFSNMIVTIPSSQEHAGIGLATFEISDLCPVCGGKRGEIFGTHSFDGSRRLNVDGWNNQCGHVDTYEDVRKEGVKVAFKEPMEFRFIANQSLSF